MADAEETTSKAFAPLLGGRAISLGFAELPARVLAALGLFVAVFLAVWMVLWAAAGGIGLGLGWLLAGAAGAFAVKLYADRVR